MGFNWRILKNGNLRLCDFKTSKFLNEPLSTREQQLPVSKYNSSRAIRYQRTSSLGKIVHYRIIIFPIHWSFKLCKTNWVSDVRGNHVFSNSQNRSSPDCSPSQLYVAFLMQLHLKPITLSTGVQVPSFKHGLGTHGSPIREFLKLINNSSTGNKWNRKRDGHFWNLLLSVVFFTGYFFLFSLVSIENIYQKDSVQPYFQTILNFVVLRCASC